MKVVLSFALMFHVVFDAVEEFLILDSCDVIFQEAILDILSLKAKDISSQFVNLLHIKSLFVIFKKVKERALFFYKRLG